MTVAGARIRPRRPEPGHPASHTSPVGLWFGTLIALFLLIAPGAIVARITQLTWPIAIAVGPALTYGVVALAIIPFGAIGIPWNGWTALAALAAVCVVMIGLQPLLARYRDTRGRSARDRSPAGADRRGRGATRRAADHVGRLPRHRALAVHPQHLGRGLARQHGALHPRHRPGVVRPTWASCATSRPTSRCTTRRCFTP